MYALALPLSPLLSLSLSLHVSLPLSGSQFFARVETLSGEGLICDNSPPPPPSPPTTPPPPPPPTTTPPSFTLEWSLHTQLHLYYYNLYLITIHIFCKQNTFFPFLSQLKHNYSAFLQGNKIFFTVNLMNPPHTSVMPSDY